MSNAMTISKRHVVLYGVIAGILLLILAASVWQTFSYLSYIRAQQAASIATPAFSAASASPEAARFTWEVATTTQAQARGLGGRADVPSRYGLLFVFPEDGTYGFWMKDMLVPIDMLWLSDSGQVVYEQENVAPDTYPDVFYPTTPARYVLETRAGEAAREGWTVGSVVPLPLPYGK